MSQVTEYDPNNRQLYSRDAMNADESQESAARIATSQGADLAAAARANKAKAPTPAPTPGDEAPDSSKMSPLAFASAMAAWKKAHPNAPSAQFKKPQS